VPKIIIPNGPVLRARPGSFKEAGLTEPQIRFIWHDAAVPAGLPVSQVYAWLMCPVTGRVLIQEHDDGVLLAGTPEAWDADLTATPVREVFEENQVRVGETGYLG
jgi:8-oxo-dGTP diphosphatase